MLQWHRIILKWKHHILTALRTVFCSTRTQHTALFFPQLFFCPVHFVHICRHQRSIPIHLFEPDLVSGSQRPVFTFTSVSWGEHLTDLHKCFVLCFRDDEVDIGCHPHTHTTEHQVTECTSWHLKYKENLRLKSNFHLEMNNNLVTQISMLTT